MKRWTHLIMGGALALSTMSPAVAQPKVAKPAKLTKATDPASTQTDATVENAKALVARVCPEIAKNVVCSSIPTDAGKDVFEMEAVNGKLHLRGNNGLSIAMALNCYLREVAHTNYDWLAEGPVTLGKSMPMPKEKVRRSCLAQERFFLNYCTYGYTMPWWSEAEWQRFIDWMAMNGINRPLMQAGLEATWLEVWKSYGIDEASLQAYFGGPAHLPWHRMANHDKWGGPLPMSYIEGQKKLQIAILKQARGLGMKPILSGFAGHVPEQFKNVRPDAKITRIAPGWGGMAAEHSTWFLAPTDPLFQEVQKKFLDAQAKMYGTDHLYGADPFNEMTPPSWEPEYLASVAKTIYGSMAAADPDSVWYQMSWTFYFDHNWTEPRLKAMTHAVPQGKLVYLDYVCEEAEFYKKTNNFHGAPFIWCYLANFGGNTHLVAPIKKMSTRITEALPVANCKGVGSTLEGINVNPIAYDLLLEQPWHPDGKVDLAAWVQSYADRRAGNADPAVRDAWKLLAEKVLLDNGTGIWGHGIAFQAKPNPDNAGGWTNHGIPYKRPDLVMALDRLLQADATSKKADGYQFDAVNLTRQALGNHTAIVRQRMMDAFKAKKADEFNQHAAELIDLGKDIDHLLATRHEFLLGRWLTDARAWGKSDAEKDYFEGNARQLITTWHKGGASLSDYSNRQWNGMIGTYYLPRWEEFIKRANDCLANDKAWDQKSYDQWRIEFEVNWSKQTGAKYPHQQQGDATAVATTLFNKWKERMLK